MTRLGLCQPGCIVFINPPAFLQTLIEKLVPRAGETVQDTKPHAHSFQHGALNLTSRPIAKGERFYRDKLAMLLNGQVDVATPAGAIVDILTATEVIEVKSVDEWKVALEQIRVYGQYYPLHRKRIHLFGSMSARKLLHIQQHCFCEGVVVTWEDK